jgi:hypothetical protein
MFKSITYLEPVFGSDIRYEYLFRIVDDDFTEDVIGVGQEWDVRAMPSAIIKCYEEKNLSVVGNLMLLVIFLNKRKNINSTYSIKDLHILFGKVCKQYTRYSNEVEKYLTLI